MKKFLEKNKIYFETIIAIALTISSIFVAISANRISEAQKEIQEKTVSPNLDISCKYDEAGKVTMVSIVNNEGHLDNISLEIFPFVSIQFIEWDRGERGSNGTSHEVFFPLVFDIGNQGLYERRAPHTKNGILFEIYNSENIEKIIDIIEAAPNSSLQEFDRYHSESTYGTDDPKKPNDYYYDVTELSLEYMVYIEYNTVFDKSNHIEKYLINTGDKNILGSSVYSDIGVKRIIKDSKEERILNEMRNERQINEYKIGMYSWVLDDPNLADTALYWMDNAIELYRNGDYTVF